MISNEGGLMYRINCYYIYQRVKCTYTSITIIVLNTFNGYIRVKCYYVSKLIKVANYW